MYRPFCRILAIITLLLALSGAALAQGLPVGTPESVGLSGPRLNRLSSAMQRVVDEHRLSGVVTLIARNGKTVHFESYGKLDREKNIPMPKDAIFRIASMSKAITSVAIVMLMEEGRLLLNDPVSKIIPSFAKTTVAAQGNGDPVPAKRAITIRDLLTHTAGISYGAGALESTYKAKDLYMWYFADNDEPIAASIDRLATLPFEAQPGERWVYGFGTDILGVVVEKVSGMSLDEFFRTRIFEPLKMIDTSFYLPPSQARRFATVYSYSQGTLTRAPDPGMGQGDYVNGPRKAFSGGAGLVSTASDYARFLQMLLNGGELDGVRVLSPKSVELMTSNHVGDLYSQGRFGFGLGFEITEHVGRSGRPGSVGEFGWGGAYYTKFWVDPAEKLVAVFMTQSRPAEGLTVQDQFRALVYQAVVESYAEETEDRRQKTGRSVSQAR
jgi:CubicO group peptidase (beta-lactamase class C family)